ncbi:DUF6332 family protein [Streptomyces sp. 2A115]|uniref:DUF6332 family protein n=1 Tax=Streptomyces sp. 2A115 TaxID=3457439 RepID=UPI003FD2F4B3
MSRRTQAERDAMTVEIGFAFFAGSVLAGATFFAVQQGLPALFASLRDDESTLTLPAFALATVAFIGVITAVLARRRAAQPNQPGRTNPDS